MDNKYGKLSGHKWSCEIINKHNCSHAEWNVKADTINIREEETLSGVVLGMLTAHWFSPTYEYYVAHAECVRCGQLIWVRSDIRCSWRDGSVVKEAVKWEPLMERESHETYKEVVALVN